MLSRIFGIKGQELTGGCRKLYKAQLHDLNFWPDITGVITRTTRRHWHVAARGEMTNA
jgi:hypothetical protein